MVTIQSWKLRNYCARKVAKCGTSKFANFKTSFGLIISKWPLYCESEMHFWNYVLRINLYLFIVRIFSLLTTWSDPIFFSKFTTQFSLPQPIFLISWVKSSDIHIFCGLLNYFGEKIRPRLIERTGFREKSFKLIEAYRDFLQNPGRNCKQIR